MAEVNTPNARPDTPSGDYKAMTEYWQTVGDLYKGAEAVRLGAERYLPKFENESADQYRNRLKWARYTNIYGDILNTLSSKPFSEEIKITDGSPRITAMVEDIDGQGNNLHNFASFYFKNAINYAVDWIYVDYTRTSAFTVDANGRARRRSVAEEKASGARPYWVRVGATEMLAVYSAVIGGVEYFVHARMRETYTERKDWDEEEVIQIRELSREPILNEMGEIIGLEPATWRVWRQASAGAGQWQVVEEGSIAIGVIPIVPLVIGERQGNSWRIVGEMNDCADLQIDLYQQETALQNARQLTAFPMLSANNVKPVIDPKTNAPVVVPVGPRAVLYAPGDGQSGGSWSYVEIQATSLKFLADQIKETVQELRELGRQPLTAQTGNLTTVTTAFAAQKGNSAVQAWALALKDALEQAFVLTALWLNETQEATVTVFTDFEAGIGEDDGFDDVLTMRKDGDLSQETLWEEAQRRGRLGDDFTVDRERERLEKEGELKDEEEQDRIDAMGGNVFPIRPPVNPDPNADPDDEQEDETEDEQSA